MHRNVRHQMPNSDSALRVVVGVRIALQLGLQAIVVPGVEVVVLAEDVDVAGDRRRLAQARRDQHASLRVELADLAEEVHAIEKSEARRVGRRHLAELFFDLEPDRHRIEAHVFAREAGEEQLAAVFALEERTKDVRNLESALIIYAGLFVPSKHTEPSNIDPLFSTNFHGDTKGRPACHVNRKIQPLSKLRQIFAF